MIVSFYLLVRGGEGYSSQSYTPVTLTPAAVTVNVTRTHAPGSSRLSSALSTIYFPTAPHLFF